MQHDFILLDRSGSMVPLWVEALSSINAYVKKLAEGKIDTGVTLAVFDSEDGLQFDVIRDRITPSTWREVTSDDACPRGMTPLNDAVGKIVNLAKAGNYDKVAIIIMTDGQENSSRELSVEQAKSLLDDVRKLGWQVIFLGANFDNASQAASYGAVRGQTLSSAKGKLGETFSAVAESRALYSSGTGDMSFTEEQKKNLATE